MKSYIIVLLLNLGITMPHSIMGIAKYKAIPLNYLVSPEFNTKQRFLSFEYNIFTAKDCQKFLGRKKIIKKGYQPIQIHISNNSDRPLSFSLSTFSLPTTSYSAIADAVHFDTTKRILGWGIPGLLLPPLLIPAFMETIESPNANEQQLIDYANKALHTTIIKPYTTLNGLVFVAKEQFDPKFSLTLIDQLTGEQFTLSTKSTFIKV